MERWRRIALEASQQSRRAHLPEIAEPVPLAQALARTGDLSLRAGRKSRRRAPHERAPGGAHASQDTVAILIGPGRRLDREERACFAAAGWTPVSLGPLILRAETAAIAALAVVTQRGC